MAISPVNVARVSQNMRLNFTLATIQRDQRSLYHDQVRISSGRAFVTPSDDPVAANRAQAMHNERSLQEQLGANLNFGQSIMLATDNAMTDVHDLLVRAQSIVSRAINNVTGESDRLASAVEIAEIRDTLMDIGNRTVDGRYIFAGRDVQRPPFVVVNDGIAYLGNEGFRHVRAAEGRLEAFNLPGSALFSAITRPVRSSVDLRPAVTAEARLNDLLGADGRPIETAAFAIDVSGGPSIVVDLSEADTLADVVARINQAAADAGAGFSAEATDVGLSLNAGGSTIRVREVGEGRIAEQLGFVQGMEISGTQEGAPLITRVTPLTRLSDLRQGQGVDVTSGLMIKNGTLSAVIDLSEAETVQDLLNAVQRADVYVDARIGDDGAGIELVGRVSGATLSVGEAGGTTATDLGIRTFDLETPLSELNGGRGVTFLEGQTDLLIKLGDGAASFEVDLDGAATIGDVIERIETAAQTAGVDISVALAAEGNGLTLSSSGGIVEVARANASPAAGDLGIFGRGNEESGELNGQDVSGVQVEGVLDILLRIENALRADDDLEITREGTRLESQIQETIKVHGDVGARSAAFAANQQALTDATLTTQALLSEVEDLDYTEAITSLQNTQTVLQAGYQTSARILNLSLLQFLG